MFQPSFKHKHTFATARIASHPTRRFGSEPFPVLLERNQVLNRTVLDIFGWGGPAILTARNKYERIEKGLDVGSWLVVGVTTPILLGQLFNRLLVPKLLLKPYNLPDTTKPLHLTWQWLDQANLKAWNQASQAERQMLSRELHHHGFHGLQALTPEITSRIRALKLGVLTMDMLLMATKGQGYYWGKNWLTEKLSGKQGFSGEFNYANNTTLEKNTATYQREHKKRLQASLWIGYGSALTLPLLIYGLLKSPVQSGKGIVGQLKRLMHAGFNHTDGIFMSKWIIAWHTMFNWNIPALLSSRDKHERRETLIKGGTTLVLYTIGDDITTGLIAKQLNRWCVKKTGQTILSDIKGPLGLPRLKPLHTLLATYGQNSLPYRLGVLNFWGGILGACAAINTLLPLVNNYYTHKKVMQEQEKTPSFQTHPTFVPLGFQPIQGKLHTP
ncbi:MAG: hypothetical protein ACKO37_04705 [Vampirovibrionales bacterium]